MKNPKVIERICDSDFFVWKHPSKEFSADAVLIVAPETKAFFVRDQKIIYTFDCGTYELSARQYPLALPGDSGETDRGEIFSCEVYFVRLNQTLRLLCKAECLDPAWGRNEQSQFPTRDRLACEVQVGDADGFLQNLIRGISVASDPIDAEKQLREKLNQIMDAMFAYALDLGYMDRYGSLDHHTARTRILREFRRTLESYGLILKHCHLDLAQYRSAAQWYKKAASSGEELLENHRTGETVVCDEVEPHLPEEKPMPYHSNSNKVTETHADQKKKRGFGLVGAAIAGVGMGVGAVGSMIGGAVGLIHDMIQNTAQSSGKRKSDQPASVQEDASSFRSSTPQIRKIQIAAVAPKRFIKGDYSPVNVVLYEEVCRGIVDALKTPGTQETQSTAQVPDNARIRVQLLSPDVEIQDNDQEAQWYGEYLTFGFGVFMPVDYQKPSIWFHARIYINGVIASNLSFMASCVSAQEQKPEIHRKDVLSAFVSYASEERDEVIRLIQGMRKARSELKVFMDVEGLRSGENWQEQLYREIDNRDVLFLCWSRAARESEWVEREWRYALRQKGFAGVDPLPLEPAEVCPPPAELDWKHFNDALNYMKKNRNW